MIKKYRFKINIFMIQKLFFCILQTDSFRFSSVLSDDIYFSVNHSGTGLD